MTQDEFRRLYAAHAPAVCAYPCRCRSHGCPGDEEWKTERFLAFDWLPDDAEQRALLELPAHAAR